MRNAPYSELNPTPHPLIYFVDDDPIDRQLYQKSFQRTFPNHDIELFSSGFEMMAATSQATRLPMLIFLDVKMPLMDGFETLMSLKADRKWSAVPVIMLTVSREPQELKLCYQLGAQSWVTKPESQEAMEQLMGLILSYWDTAARTPYTT
ncbi:response regulator receiver protein [Fibrisoma limi BUZ 3]|uniref:Response regulator receiver protein n=1 Tax=Fibrisoma limi BUZ 3 TaxID=1185876 RepID=I2GIU1_9BACT|nr:response regulator [Fibrisoma limi]CCH53816.1 response regulator receiver protein [Fibrisoma limi BUZ 3]